MRGSLRLDEVAVKVQRRQVLKDVSVTVGDGARVTILGPRGFGGTTLARAIAGTVPVSAGKVFIRGQDHTDSPPGRRHVALIPASGGLFPQMTVEDNVLYGVQLRNAVRHYTHALGDRAIERMSLAAVRGQRPHELAPEQRIRVALARASVGKPRVLVIDATAGAPEVTGLARLISDAHLGSRTSIVVCTHDARVATGDDSVVAVTGEAPHPAGRMTELQTRPRDLSTAELVHPLPLPVADAICRRTELRAEGIRLALTTDLGAERRLKLALPPAAVLPGDGHAGRVTDVRPHGVRTAVQVALDHLSVPLWYLVIGMSVPRIGDRVRVELDTEQLLLFDALTPGHPRVLPAGA